MSSISLVYSQSIAQSSAKVKEGKIGENMYDANVDSLPVSLENLDFNPAATCSDFVFDVTAD